MDLTIIPYAPQWEEKWDRFVLGASANGTFLQTRRFLNYHPEGRFRDASLLVMDGSNIVAVLPACSTLEEGKTCFFSHKGSTFGGIVIDRAKYSISMLDRLFPALDAYLSSRYETAFLRQTSDVFSRVSGELMDYYYYRFGYRVADELSFYIDCTALPEDLTAAWASGRRRDYRYSLKNGLVFRELRGDGELESFYRILEENLARHQASPVHTLDELRSFRDERLTDIVRFYGVFLGDRLIAGTMVFLFGSEVMHTQYLAQDAAFSHLFTMNFLIFHLISLCRGSGFPRFSFGISTEDRGKTLNSGLAVFKEGFGSSLCNNRSYIKTF